MPVGESLQQEEDEDEDDKDDDDEEGETQFAKRET